jgi:UDP-glucose 4-epimerase
MKYFVTGGAGFIGSHIVERLLQENHEVTVYDNYSSGNHGFIDKLKINPNLKVIGGDICDLKFLVKAMKGHDFVFHLAANADVRNGMTDTDIDFKNNIQGTKNVLESMRVNGIKKIAFSSSATVYGEPKTFPTPETEPLIQTSLYGASKACGESLIQGYCEFYDMQCWIFRFVSWIGEHYTHGVIFDFINKLRDDSSQLEILGDGNQKKSYLYVKDGVDGIFLGIKEFNEKVNIFNLGYSETMNVTELAKIIIKEMKLSNVKINFTGGIRGWKGDSPLVQLDTTKLNAKGWRPTTNIKKGVILTTKYLLENPELLERRK